tara:strand:- start:593 stop:961 length:369 start_codon:yes stop_codon:yes gene_type:complete
MKAGKGLGDTIESLTKALGIKAAIDWFSDKTGVDCGCDARKEEMNRLFPYTKPNCFEGDEYEWLSNMVEKATIKKLEQDRLNEIYNRVFNEQVVGTGCASCLRGRISELKRLMKTYEGGRPL